MLYLVCFDRPFRHARHYLGYTKDESTLARRLEHHAAGRGSRLLAAVAGAGIGWRVVWTGEGDRAEERRLKNRNHGPRLCPVCRSDRAGTPAASPERARR